MSDDRGMQSPQGRNAIIGLILVLLFILVVTIINPGVIQSFDDLIPVIKEHPLLVYILNIVSLILAVWLGFFRKTRG